MTERSWISRSLNRVRRNPRPAKVSPHPVKARVPPQPGAAASVLAFAATAWLVTSATAYSTGIADPPESLALPAPGAAQAETGETVILRGGWLFDSIGDERVRNTGIVVRAGKLFAVGANEAEIAALVASADADGTTVSVVDLSDGETILAGLFDLHAHHAMDLFGEGRRDEVEYNPLIFLANGATSVFPGGEMDPERFEVARREIDAGLRPGPRIMRSGPYFGTARPGWDRGATEQEIRDQVDYWAGQGVAGFKAKGISPVHLRALIEQAHLHALPVTGHLDSGARNSVNPRDAILMGIDRIEHFMGGDAMPPERSAYASLVDLTPDTPEFRRIADLYIRHGVNFDATMSAYGYFGERDPEVYTYWEDEKSFLTPFTREQVESRQRRVSDQFETIYWVKRKLLKGFYDAGGGHLITLGTDHPSWGEFLSGFGVQRELHSFVLSGIPPADAIKMGTINGARAMGFGDDLGTIEAGKLADLFVVEGNPLADIRDARNVRLVMRAGRIYEARKLLDQARGKIGAAGPEEVAAWGRR